jgi:lipopolysaccharide/colanic/teichoic acid biosynthesis glycosyltransferase
VTPGMTCIWQTNGRHHVTEFDDCVRMDLDYIDNWSLALDVRLLAKTALIIVSGTGA